MLSLEDQIKELADYAFETTDAVQFEPPADESIKKRGLPSPLLAVAAVLAIVAGGIGTSRLLENEQIETVSPAITDLKIEDPLNINLDPLIETSAQARLNAIGEYTTFDFDQLPEGWSAEQNFAATISSTPPTFWQQVLVSGPGPIRLVVNVTGRLDGGAALPGSESVAAEGTAIVGDKEVTDLGSGTVRWIENETTEVQILNSGLGLNTAEEAIELAGYLVPVVTNLDWQLEARRMSAEPREEWRQLSGLVEGKAWHVILDGGRLVLVAGPEFSNLGGGPPTISPPDPSMILSTVESVGIPGGVVLFGHAPETVRSVRLNLANGTAVLPVVSYETDRVAFAVPISDRLDPISVEFLDADLVVIETKSLSHLVPYGS